MQRKIANIFLALLLASSSLFGWNSFEYFPPLKVPYHPVSTKSKEAQAAFDEGLVAIYGFNYDQALQSFDRASQLDPELAMAYWGMALAIDQNLSNAVTANHAELTTSLCEKALKLCEKATKKEQRYIKALFERFSKDPKQDKAQLRLNYMKAMEQLAHDYPDDDDALTLYSESIMDSLNWNLWTSSGNAREGTLQIVNNLESVLKRNPYHIGANHYYIHALEFSPYPQRALISAEQLDSMHLSQWGHLLHTPTHIYLRLGMYDRAVEDNLRAIEADKRYIKEHGLEGQYPLKYLAHNLFYLTVTYMWQEREAEALRTANELQAFIQPHAEQAPSLKTDLLMPLHVLLYFHRWDEILALPQLSNRIDFLHLFQTFAQSMAKIGKGGLEEVRKAKESYLKEEETFFAARKDAREFTKDFFRLAHLVLTSAAAQKEGQFELCQKSLKEASELQDEKLEGYIWPYPVCQTFGALLIKMARYYEAEQIYRHSLSRYQGNGRTLFGLQEALKGQEKPYYTVEREAKEALKYAQQPLSVNLL